ncbi:amino-acid N-acetyltransferase [Canibacter zhoujuaniae]|uniref:amino-acid N-acetyltransferase n=1 Tax=Canibacter zhoujuaniae TaxID=2708343 RepID=UPI0014208CA6|nr:amino-acid N-acetyltransferase [Canibacter zhoujuaniae]
MTLKDVSVRKARTGDVPRILEVMQPLVENRILLGKDPVTVYETIQQFYVAEDASGELLGFGALHVMWEHLGEVRTLAVVPEALGKGVGHALVERIEADAIELGLKQLVCLTFEVEFFARHGFQVLPAEPGEFVAEAYEVLLSSRDEGVAEFLDLARVRPNTLGNTRMVKTVAQ